MIPNLVLRALGATAFFIPLASAHMQMLIPSPFRDPNADRKDEPKDYNILTPLHADGSDFACKGYQWNTPWTTVATYEAGESYEMTLKGTATHEGGSCQLSLSCDGGIHFKVIKSIVGGCPLEKRYPFTIPPEFAKMGKTTCLFAWTWFNKIGNREMYMNCAVVDIVPKKRKSGGRPPATGNAPRLNGRDVARANAAAQSLLAGYPDLFVANLKNINSCTVRETMNVVFDDPGHSVSFSDGASGSSSPTFKRGVCKGAGLNSADSLAYSSTGSTGGWKASSSPGGGQDWTWQGGDSSGQGTSESQGDDDGQWRGWSDTSQNNAGNNGQWQPQGQTSSYAQFGDVGQPATTDSDMDSKREQMQANLSPVDLNEVGLKPDANVQSELDAYLAKLYGESASNGKREVEGINDQSASSLPDSEEDSVVQDSRRTTREKRWGSYNQRRAELSPPNREAVSDAKAAPKSEAESETDATTENHEGAAMVFAPLPSKSDDAYYSILAKLNSLGDTVFTLIKFASTYLDGPPPGNYIFAAVSSENGNITTLRKRASTDDSADKATLRAMLLRKLSGMQNKVSTLLQFAKNKMKASSGGLWNKIKRSFMPSVWKRQLIISGIFPATLQNNEPFYFEPSAAPDSKHAHNENTGGQDDTEQRDEAKLIKRQGDGVGEPGAAEELFPNVSHDSLYDGLEDPSTAQPYDWSLIYPDMRQVVSDRIPPVVGPKPVADWPSPSEDPVYSGGREPAVVGPTPVSDWSAHNTEDEQSDDGEDLDDEVCPDFYDGGQDNMTLPAALNVTMPVKPTAEIIYLPPVQATNITGNFTTATSNPSQTAIPAPYNDTKNSNLTLGDALKLTFPELINDKPIGEPIAQPPRYTEPNEDDLWRDGVFPGLLDARQKLSLPTHIPAEPSPSSSPDANDEDIAALLPYFLGPGPAMPPSVTGHWPTPLEPQGPGNLETMPQVINDLGPEDEEQIRNFFSELAEYATETAVASPTPSSSSSSSSSSFSIPPKNKTTTTSTTIITTPHHHHHPLAPRQLDPQACATNRDTLRQKLKTYQATLRAPCNTRPYVQMTGPSRVQMENALRDECREARRSVARFIGLVTRVLNGGCDGVEELVREMGEGGL
ncbi:hypothetical protein J1614_004941 [Plenodomus biglobosus]|nr:hypothetical protein J1614_004941 [Plenodomus biglobosus]